MKKLDLEECLYRTAADAKKQLEKVRKDIPPMTYDGLDLRKALKAFLEELLEREIYNQLKSGLNGDMPAEDAILHLNQIARKEEAFRVEIPEIYMKSFDEMPFLVSSHE